MSKIVLLVSREDMLHQAHNILQEKRYEIYDMKVINTSDAVSEARSAIASGASIIIARGLQASLIKQYTDVPVVEISMTTQEMALLTVRARQIINKEKPIIGVIGFANMFCDMTYFDQLFGVELRTYFASSGAQLPAAVSQAVEDEVDLIIGGETAIKGAEKAGIPSLFLSMTEESLRQAFDIAERIDYAINVEKKSAAQMETLLDYVPEGVVRLEMTGLILSVNPLAENLIGRTEADLKGKHIREIAPQIRREELDRVLVEGKEYSCFWEWNHERILAVLAPVLYEGNIDGAILTCHKINRQLSSRKDSGKNGKNTKESLPLLRFDDILQESEAMRKAIRRARQYAMSDFPVMLVGEAGTELRMLAESIHNESGRSSETFWELSCKQEDEKEQTQTVFGEHGGAFLAQGGTLFLRDIQKLTPANQFRLCRLIRKKEYGGEHDGRTRRADVRIMAASEKSLAELRKQGLGAELYYLLSGLELEIPPLRRRKEDLRKKIELCLRQCCDRYGRYHVLTHGAMEVLLKYPWPGNHLQIESFCEHLILTAERRSLDEIVVRELLEEMYPSYLQKGNENRNVIDEGKNVKRYNEPDGRYRGSEAAGTEGMAYERFMDNEEVQQIVAALRKYGGNREKTAKALGISKATLWRHMKKWGIRSEMR